MINEQIWLIKLLVAHLLTDFVLQPSSWVEHRGKYHFASSRLYLHGLTTGAVALLFIGLAYWPLVLIITVTHIIIDGWKSYRPKSTAWFLIDQGLHLAIITGGWIYYFISFEKFTTILDQLRTSGNFWIYTAGSVFLSTPAGIFIGYLTRKWRNKLQNAESLENAGKWIGIIERLIVFTFVLLNQYSAISILVAAKGIIRFNEKDRPEIKTEYLVIGTLMSIGLAMLVGLIVKHLVL